MKTEVICENCDKPFLKDSYEVERSKKLGRSINCSRHCGAVSSNKKSTRTGDVKNLGKLARKDEFTPFRFLFRNCKQRAKTCRKRVIPFELTLDDLVNKWKEQKGKCPYTNYDLIQPYDNVGKPSTPRLASVDRIDSSKGYTKDNVEIVCLVINYAKNKFSKEEMKDFFQKMNL